MTPLIQISDLSKTYVVGDVKVHALRQVSLHVNGGEFPQLKLPEGKAWAWKELRRQGDVVAAILDAAKQADLIVMATEGRHGVIDAMRGSITESVVRGAPCPVLAVPERSSGESDQ